MQRESVCVGYAAGRTGAWFFCYCCGAGPTATARADTLEVTRACVTLRVEGLNRGMGAGVYRVGGRDAGVARGRMWRV
jgi:hypothetical protein